MALARRWRGRQYLVSPLADFLMVGGLGLLLMGLFALFVPPDIANDITMRAYSPLLAGILTYHVFAINYPHFAFSYQLAYRDLRTRLLSAQLPLNVRLRYWFALLGFPLLYLSYCIYAMNSHAVTADGKLLGPLLLGYLVNLMFLTVGWHYAKQCFGVMIVLSALKQIRFSLWQRRILLTHAMLVWLVSWLGGNIWMAENQYFGLAYRSFTLGSMFPQTIQPHLLQLHYYMRATVLVLGVGIFIMLLVKGWREKKRPSLAAIVGYYLMYPLILIGYKLHPLWFWIVPAVHSLQYFPFVIAYKRNEAALKPRAEQPSFRARHSLALFVALAVVIGAMQFGGMPHVFNAIVSSENRLFMPLLLFALVHLFVNIHHYFIDNVIWRKENPEVGRYLFHAG